MASSRHLSVRLDAETLEQLEAQSRQTGQPVSRVVKTLLDEGLRMQEHPGIVFRSGPAGRRPGLAHGPDVWEVARVFREARGEGHDAVHRTADLTGLTSGQVNTVVRYYAAYEGEIDTWIRRVDEEAERAEAAWRHEQRIGGHEAPSGRDVTARDRGPTSATQLRRGSGPGARRADTAARSFDPLRCRQS